MQPQSIDNSDHQAARHPSEISPERQSPCESVAIVSSAPARSREKFSPTLAALLVYACCWFGGMQYYSIVCQRAARALPKDCDVLLAGSSVIDSPLLAYEFPQKNTAILSDRFPVLEAHRFESLLSSCGAPQLTVFSASVSAQKIEETEDFVRGVASLNKHPRLLVLFIAPIVCLGSDKSVPAGFLPQAIASSAQHWQQNFHDFRFRVQKPIGHLTSMIYSQLHFTEPVAAKRQRVNGSYRKHYCNHLSSHKLASIERIIEICKAHSIRITIVSSPLTEDNRALMSGFSYNQYHETVASLVARATGESADCGNFVDLGQAEQFEPESDFYDPVHLNGKGGAKMFELLAPNIVHSLGDRV